MSKTIENEHLIARSQRRQNKKSIREIALLSGLKPSVISEFENGIRELTMIEKTKLFHALNPNHIRGRNGN